MIPGNAGVLSGVRVLDLGTMIAGPVAATLLADFGAEVIKIEQPEGGDPIRRNGAMVDGEGLWWNVEGRNKRSVTLNLREESGQKLLRDLASKVDVVVENFRPGTMARWGLDYDSLSKNNPGLIMLSVSGYGQTGPYSERPAYDRIALAFSGLLGITGFPDRPPIRPGTAVADYQSALMGAFAVMLALFHRDARGGVGQLLDVSLYESVFRFSDILVTAYDKLGKARERAGNLHFAAAPGDHFETSDGRYLVITVSSDGIFSRLCRAMGRADLENDARFSDHASRWEHIEIINGIVAQWIKQNPVDDVCAALNQYGLAYSLVYTAADIMADPHYAARESIVDIDHAKLGKLKVPAPQPRLTRTPASSPRPAPELGADTDAILTGWLSLSAAEIEAFRQSGVV